MLVRRWFVLGKAPEVVARFDSKSDGHRTTALLDWRVSASGKLAAGDRNHLRSGIWECQKMCWAASWNLARPIR
jgi:hypothetical protein